MNILQGIGVLTILLTIVSSITFLVVKMLEYKDDINYLKIEIEYLSKYTSDLREQLYKIEEKLNND